VGGIEALGLIARRLDLHGPFWNVIAALSDNFGNIGYLIIGIFLVSWIGSVIVYRVKGYDRIA